MARSSPALRLWQRRADDEPRPAASPAGLIKPIHPDSRRLVHRTERAPAQGTGAVLCPSLFVSVTLWEPL